MDKIWSQIYGYWCGIQHYRWYGVLGAWVIAIVGWVYVIHMPNKYESTARVYVDTESLLRPLLSGLAVQPNVEQRLSIMTQTLLSQPNLEKVIQQTDMDLSIKTPKEKEILLNGLKEAIKLQVSRDNLYKISYEAAESQLARRVVQSILNIFVEKTLGSSQSDSTNARQFIEQQIKIYEQLLNSSEKELMDFKREHVGLMPSEKGDYYQRLQAALEKLEEAHTKLNIAVSRREAIKRQLGGEMPVIGFGSSYDTGSIKDPINGPITGAGDMRIQLLQEQLNEALLKYTDKHPAVTALKETIAMLRRQKDESPSKNLANNKIDDVNRGEAEKHQPEINLSPLAGNFYYQQMQVSLAEADAEIATQKAQIDALDKNTSHLRELVDTVPKVEVELAVLTRDYGVYKQNYEQLLARRESAKIGGNVDESPENVKFRIVDPPTEPVIPSSPKRPLLITVVLFAAIGAGIAFAFLLSQLKLVFYTREDLEDIIGVPVLGIVSTAISGGDLRKNRADRIYFFSLFGFLIAGYGLLMANYLFNIKLFSMVKGLVS